MGFSCRFVHIWIDLTMCDKHDMDDLAIKLMQAGGKEMVVITTPPPPPQI